MTSRHRLSQHHSGWRPGERGSGRTYRILRDASPPRATRCSLAASLRRGRGPCTCTACCRGGWCRLAARALWRTVRLVVVCTSRFPLAAIVWCHLVFDDGGDGSIEKRVVMVIEQDVRSQCHKRSAANLCVWNWGFHLKEYIHL